MSTRHVLVGERVQTTGQQVKKKVKASRTIQGFRMKPGYLYTVVRAISARVNQNYDGWPSSELKQAYHTFIGKPVFVNHENYDPDKARGVVVAARYIENGNDKYIEVVQEIDAKRFPKLAHEIRTGGLDSVSMGAEAGFTICSACGNKAYDEPDMCDHVLFHKGEHIRVRNRKTGKMEDKLVYESCHKLSFFELSYVFDPADETAVASKVLVANRKKAAIDWEHHDTHSFGHHPDGFDYILDPDGDTGAHDVYRQDPNGDSWHIGPAGTRSEAVMIAEQDDPYQKMAGKTAGQCAPGDVDCNTPDPRGLPPTAFPKGDSGAAAGANAGVDLSAVPGQSGSGSGGGGGGDPQHGDAKVMPHTKPLYDDLSKSLPGTEIGTYRVDDFHEHDHGAMDVMTSDPQQMEMVKQKAFDAGAPYVLMNQTQYNADGTSSGMEDRGDPTQNHYDHVHIAPIGASRKFAAPNFKPYFMMSDEEKAQADAEAQRQRDAGEALSQSRRVDLARERQRKNPGGSFPILESERKAFVRHAVLSKLAGDDDWEFPWAMDAYRQHRDDNYGGVDSHHAMGHFVDQLNNTMGGLSADTESKMWGYLDQRLDSPGLGPYGRDTQNPHGPYPKGEVPSEKYTVPRAMNPQQRLNKTADATDDYLEWAKRVDSGEEVPEKGPKQLLPNKGLQDWSQRTKKRMASDGEDPSGGIDFNSGVDLTNDPQLLDPLGPLGSYNSGGAGADGINDGVGLIGQGVAAIPGAVGDANAGLNNYIDTLNSNMEGQEKWTGGADVTGISGDAPGGPLEGTSGPLAVQAAIDEYNTQATQRKNTYPTYSKAHDYFDKMGAPTDGVLDYGAGLGHSAQWGHTYEPHPREGFEPTYVKPEDIPEGAHGRVTNLNVLNVVPPEIRHQIVDGIGRSLAPGGHAIITTRGTREVLDTKGAVPADNGDPNAVRVKGTGYQKGFTRPELHQYVSDRLGPDFTVKPVPIGPAGVHIIRNAGKTANLRSLVRTAALKKLGWGETEAPTAVDTLREEGSDMEDDNNDYEEWVKPPEPPEDDNNDWENMNDSPEELSMPNLDQAAQIDREQEADPGQPDPGNEPGGEEDAGNYITLKLPMPQQPAVGVPPTPEQPQVPMQTFGSRVAALQTLAFFERYYGYRIADWRNAIEAGRSMSPEEQADFIRESALLTLENSASDSTTSRNTVKGTANMARSSTLATRRKTAGTKHFAEGPLVDTGDQSRNDQGEQEEAFITETPAPDSTDLPDDDAHNISNTEDNLVADAEYARSLTSKLAQQKRELEATAREYARVAGRRKHADEYAGGPTAGEVNPEVPTSAAEKLTGDDFDSADPNPSVDTSVAGPGTTTLPIESSLQAFRAFDSWLKKTTKKSSREHSERNIKKAAKQFADYNGIQVQAMFPALGIALRQARKNEAAKKGKNMRRKAVDLETAAPDERVSVPTPVADTTDADAQASQFEEAGWDNNAGKDITDPDLGTGQNFAPGQAPEKRESRKKADGILAIRCAEAMIAAGLEPNTRERKYQLAREFEKMSRGLILDRTALAERFAMVRHADRQHYSKVAAGGTRGANQSPIPSGFGQGGTSRQASTQQRVAANSPEMDYTLYG